MNTHANLVWIRQDDATTSSHIEKPQHTRKSHRKSRSGCITCKARRVKRPACGQCSYRRIACSYITLSRHRKQDHCSPHPGQPSPKTTTNELSSEACLGTDVFATAISRMVSRSTASGNTPNSFVYILRHFEQSGYQTLSSPTGQSVFHDSVLSMVMTYPFLTHAVLAFSATHLHHLSPRNAVSHGITKAAAYHTQRALTLYSRCISSPALRGQSGCLITIAEMDALIGTCVMLTSLFYHVNEPDLCTQNAWTLGPSPGTGMMSYLDKMSSNNNIDWVTYVPRELSGLNILLQVDAFRKQLSRSAWFPFFAEASPEHAPGDNPKTSQLKARRDAAAQTDPNTLVPHLTSLILASTNPAYATALSSLTPLFVLDPQDTDNFSSFITWPITLSEGFSDLLREAKPDVPCLLLRGYWFDRMSRIPHWWCQERGKGEVRAVRRYIDAVVEQQSLNRLVKADRLELLRKAVEEFNMKTWRPEWDDARLSDEAGRDMAIQNITNRTKRFTNEWQVFSSVADIAGESYLGDSPRVNVDAAWAKAWNGVVQENSSGDTSREKASKADCRVSGANGLMAGTGGLAGGMFGKWETLNGCTPSANATNMRHMWDDLGLSMGEDGRDVMRSLGYGRYEGRSDYMVVGRDGGYDVSSI